jgi:hypothetical protein
MVTVLEHTRLSTPTTTRPLGATAWLTVGASVLLLCLLSVAKRPELLRVAVCLCAVLVGLVIYRANAVIYAQYTLWLWLFTPLLRRLIDFHFGFADQNLVLIAPILVTSLSFMSLGHLAGASIRKAPFLLCMAAVFYGFTIGMLINPSAEVVYGLFNWIGPIFFGLFLYINWASYPQMKKAIQTVVLWGTFLIGAYGIYQYCIPPRWDVYWWQSLPYGLVAAFGRPFPYQVRVWSTLNAPAPFASVMAVFLLLNFGSRSKLTLAFSFVGFAALALSLVRAEWLGCIVGVAYLGLRSKPIYLIRGIVLIFLVALLSAPLLTIGSANQVIQERLNSFSHLSQDDSVQTRLAMYEHLTGDLLQTPFGHGVSNAAVYKGYSLDSGPLTLLYNFGLLGTLFYLSGIGAALILLIRSKSSGDIFQVACAAVLISSIARLIAMSPYMNVAGVMVWLCVGMGLAAQRFHAATIEEKFA